MPCLRLNKTSRSDSPGSRSQGGPRKRPLKLSVMTSQALRAWCGLKFLLTERKDVLLERESVRLQTWSLGCSSFRWFFVPESPVLLPRGSQRWHFGEWVRQPSRGPLMRPPHPPPTLLRDGPGWPRCRRSGWTSHPRLGLKGRSASGSGASSLPLLDHSFRKPAVTSQGHADRPRRGP